MDDEESRMYGHLGQDLNVFETCNIGKGVLFGFLPSIFVLASFGSALVPAESLLAVAFTLTIGVSLSSALLFIGLSPLLLLLDALLSFLSLLLEFFRSVIVSFLFVLFVPQTLLVVFLSFTMFRPSSVLDIIR